MSVGYPLACVVTLLGLLSNFYSFRVSTNLGNWEGPGNGNPFAVNQAIWAHSTVPTTPEVALFRHTFTLTAPLDAAELWLFADTRYEVWIDGHWVGRGPARFSTKRHEYDVYHLGTLTPETHVIAVLVQWAPNSRRSESVTPYLIGHVQGSRAQGLQVVTRTDATWKAQLSAAWHTASAPVHTWGLLGPTELLDFRQLPAAWQSLAFDDSLWAAACVKPLPTETTFHPRSIPMLASVPFSMTLLDQGGFSPGYLISEWQPGATTTLRLPFTALAPTNLVVETLNQTASATAAFRPDSPISPWLKRMQSLAFPFATVNDQPLTWIPAGELRPDVYQATIALPAGTHTLTFNAVSREGMTFAVSTQHLDWPVLPFSQGTHAGRRLLLANPVSLPEAVMLAPGAVGVTLTFHTAPTYAVLDLGRVVHGRLLADAVGPAGAVVDIGWDERLYPGTLRPLPYPGTLHPEWNQTDSWILDGTTRALTTLDTRAGRYILIAVWDAPVMLYNLRVVEERYPVVARGAFHATPTLDRIWQVGVDTLYPNMTDAYTDTPWRERGQWWGDAYVSDHINRVAFGDTHLLRRGALLMGESFTAGRPLALAPNGAGVYLLDYGMLWVQSLQDYVQLSGDIQVLAELYPVLQQFLAYLTQYESPDTGLLDVPPGDWWQTAFIDWRGEASRAGQSTALNALYYGTLLDAATLADAFAQPGEAALWRARAAALKYQVNTYLYMPLEHRYATSILDGAWVAPTPHAQAWPLAYGLVPPEKAPAVVKSLKALLPKVGIYGVFWILEGLGQTRHIPLALEIIKSYYGRLLDLGATTWWEGFNSHLHYSSSLSHAWGGAPTWFLTTYVLGARQTGPHTWQVTPAFSGVAEASGQIPLLDEVLTVAWLRQGCETRDVWIQAPPDTQGEIVIAEYNATTVLSLNGQTVWQPGRVTAPEVTVSADGIHVAVAAGVHHLSVQQTCTKTFLPAMFQEMSAK